MDTSGPAAESEVVAPSSGSSSSSSSSMETEAEDDEEAALAAALALSMQGNTSTATPTDKSAGEFIGAGLPPTFTGMYEIHSVVTHKGASCDSGHYIGWVRKEPGSDIWWCYNDAKVTEVKTSDILLLKGGGDRDTAYLVFYRFKEKK